jgi:hypothetical protein
MQASNAYILEYFSVLTIMSLQSVYEARKGPSELKVDILGACVEMLGKAIDELKREIFVFVHKTRHAEVERVDVTDSEEDDETDSRSLKGHSEEDDADGVD